jgi:hypothetical protein
MGDPPQDPYSPPPPPGGQPPIGGPQPPQGWQQQPGQPPVEPYPGYADTHADYYRRQQEAAQQAAQQAAIGPPVPVNPLRHLGNWGALPPRPGLNPEEKQVYDGYKRVTKRLVLRFLVLAAVLLSAVIVGIVRALLT